MHPHVHIEPIADTLVSIYATKDERTGKSGQDILRMQVAFAVAVRPLVPHSYVNVVPGGASVPAAHVNAQLVLYWIVRSPVELHVVLPTLSGRGMAHLGRHVMLAFAVRTVPLLLQL